MFLQDITILNFKNYQECELDFSKGINLISGDNGAGKTNLLDAIHYLCISKSAFSSIDNFAVKHDQLYFSVIGNFVKSEERFKVICGLKVGDKKVLSLNNLPYTKISDHIGKFPCVLIAPDHISIVKEGSEDRRRFFDNVISQVNPEYLEQLIVYNKYLKARNQLLKQFFEKNYKDMDLLQAYSEPLIQSGTFVYNTRKTFLDMFFPIFQGIYMSISSAKEEVHIEYESQLHGQPFNELNQSSISDDLKVLRTTIGIHLDEFLFTIKSQNLRKFGSQGQQKTFLLALKIAQHHVIETVLQQKPLMLLDDIFDKLDDTRIQKLLDMCKGGDFGQVFITDARKDRTQDLFKKAKINVKVLEVKDGHINDIYSK